MNDMDQGIGMDTEENKKLKKIFGIALLSLGVVVCLFVLYTIVGLLSGGGQVDLVRSIVPEEVSTAAREDTSGLVTLAEQGLVAFGYIVVIFLLSVAVRIASVLLSTGAGLLNADLATVAERLRKELVKWRKEEY
jgi:hypothetical protein